MSFRSFMLLIVHGTSFISDICSLKKGAQRLFEDDNDAKSFECQDIRESPKKLYDSVLESYGLPTASQNLAPLNAQCEAQGQFPKNIHYTH